MKLPLQETAFDRSQYERPNQKWVCGHACEGRPCDLGPDSHGRCPSAAFSACKPQTDAEGNGYRCTRPPVFGGPCKQGPRPDGSCCQPMPVHAPCQPRLSLRARRNRWTALAAATALGILLLAMAGPWGREVVSPGPLIASHAGLPAMNGQPDNCAACHDSGMPSEAEAMFMPAIATLGAASSEKCIACHFAGEPQGKAVARMPHSSSHELLRWAEADRLPAVQQAKFVSVVDTITPRIDRHAELSCTACHRDHHGNSPSMTGTEQSCHSCHSEQFASFTHGHPEFTPRSNRAGIAFDHAGHAQTDHFGDRGFRCADCHRVAEGGGQMLTASYERACAGCHMAGEEDHHSLQITRSPPITLFQMLDPEDYDANPGLPPMLSLLLAASPESREVIKSLGPADVFADLEDEPKAAVMKEVTKLQGELAGRKTPEIKQRLASVLELSPEDPALTALASSLLSGKADASGKQVTHAVSQHSDELLRRWLDLGAIVPAEGDAELAKLRASFFKQLSETTGKSCLRCHIAEPQGINWTAAGRAASEWSYRKFDHQSHMMVLGATSCAACHPAASPGQSAGSSIAAPTGLMPVQTGMCISCHKPQSGGLDSCLTCHQYHLHRP